MNRVLQPRPLVVLGLNVWMGTAAGADELVEVPYIIPPENRSGQDILTGSVTSKNPVSQQNEPTVGPHELSTYGLYRRFAV